VKQKEKPKKEICRLFSRGCDCGPTEAAKCSTRKKPKER